MGGMPDWFAKTRAMIDSDKYFSLADAGSEAHLVERYRDALSRLDADPADYGDRSESLKKVDPSYATRQIDHFNSDWIYYRYRKNPVQYGNYGGAYWPAIPSSVVVDLIREGTKLAIHKALGATELAAVPGLTQRYLDDIWEPELENHVEIDGVRPLATSWNCVAPAGSTYFEVAALRGPSVVEFAIATPKPYGHSSMMYVIERVIDGHYAGTAES
jgi:hypothetical protein